MNMTGRRRKESNKNGKNNLKQSKNNELMNKYEKGKEKVTK